MTKEDTKPPSRCFSHSETPPIDNTTASKSCPPQKNDSNNNKAPNDEFKSLPSCNSPSYSCAKDVVVARKEDDGRNNIVENDVNTTDKFKNDQNDYSKSLSVEAGTISTEEKDYDMSEKMEKMGKMEGGSDGSTDSSTSPSSSCNNEEEEKKEDATSTTKMSSSTKQIRKTPLTTRTFTTASSSSLEDDPSTTSSSPSQNSSTSLHSYDTESNTSSVPLSCSSSITLTPCSSVASEDEFYGRKTRRRNSIESSITSATSSSIHTHRRRYRRHSGSELKDGIIRVTTAPFSNSTMKKMSMVAAAAPAQAASPSLVDSDEKKKVVGKNHAASSLTNVFENLDHGWWYGSTSCTEKEEKEKVELGKMCLACLAAILDSNLVSTDFVYSLPPLYSEEEEVDHEDEHDEQDGEESDEEEDCSAPILPKSALYFLWSTCLLPTTTSCTELLEEITETLCTKLKYLILVNINGHCCFKIAHEIYIHYGLYILQQQYKQYEEVKRAWHVKFGMALQKVLLEENGESEEVKYYAANYLIQHALRGCPTSCTSSPTSPSEEEQKEKENGDNLHPQDQDQEEEKYEKIIELLTNSKFIKTRMEYLMHYSYPSPQDCHDDDQEEEEKMDALIPTRLHISDMEHLLSFLKKEKTNWEEVAEKLYQVWGDECSRILSTLYETDVLPPVPKTTPAPQQAKPEELDTMSLSSDNRLQKSKLQQHRIVRKNTNAKGKKKQRKTNAIIDRNEEIEGEESDDFSSLSGSSYDSTSIDNTAGRGSGGRIGGKNGGRGSSRNNNKKRNPHKERYNKSYQNWSRHTTQRRHPHYDYLAQHYKRRTSLHSTTPKHPKKGASALLHLTNKRSDEPVTLDKILDLDLNLIWLESSLARSFHELSISLSSQSSSSSTKIKELQVKFLRQSISLYSEITLPLSYLLSKDLERVDEEDVNHATVASGHMPCSISQSKQKLKILKENCREAHWLTMQIRILASEGWYCLGSALKDCGKGGLSGEERHYLKSLVSGNGGDEEEEKQEKQGPTPLDCYQHAIHLLDLKQLNDDADHADKADEENEEKELPKKSEEEKLLTQHKKSLAGSVLHSMAVLHYEENNYNDAQTYLEDCITIRRGVLQDLQESDVLKKHQSSTTNGERSKINGSVIATSTSASLSTASPISTSVGSMAERRCRNSPRLLFSSPPPEISTTTGTHDKDITNTPINSSSSSSASISTMEQSLSTSLEYAALCLHTEGSFQASLSLFQEALLLRTIHSGKNSLDVASLQYNMGVVHDDMGQYEASLSRYNESLRTRYSHYTKYCNDSPTTTSSPPPPFDKRIGDLEESIVLTLNCMGYVYQLLDDLDGAISCYYKVAEILGGRHKRMMMETTTTTKQQQQESKSKDLPKKKGFDSKDFPPVFLSLFPELVLDEIRHTLAPQEKASLPSVGGMTNRVSSNNNKALKMSLDMSYLVGDNATKNKKGDEADDDIHSNLSHQARAYSNLVFLIQRKKHGNFGGGPSTSVYSGQQQQAAAAAQSYRSNATGKTSSTSSSGSRSLALALKSSSNNNNEIIHSSDDSGLMNVSYRLGQIHVKFGEWDKAVEQMEQALRSMWTLYPNRALPGGGESCSGDETDTVYSAGSQSKRHEWRKHKRAVPIRKKEKFGESNQEEDEKIKVDEDGKEEDAAEEGKIYYALALSHAALGDHERAIRYYTTSLRYVKERVGSESIEVARILYLQGLSYWRLPDWEKSGLVWGDCLRILLRSRDSAAKMAGTPATNQSLNVQKAKYDGSTSSLDFQISVVLYSIAASKCALGRYSDPSTLTCLNDAQTILTSNNNDNKSIVSGYVANILFYQGLVHFNKASEVPIRLQRVENGTTLNDLIIASEDESVSQASVDDSWEGLLLQVMSCMNDAFAIYTEHSLFPDAESSSKKKEKVPSEMAMVPRANRLVVAHIRYIQGQVHHKLGFYEGAMMYYGVALRWYQRLLSRNSIYAASVLNSMGGLCLTVGGERNDQIAAQCYEEALSIRQDFLGMNHTAIASTLSSLASVCAKIDNYDRAMHLYHESLMIYTANEGKEGKNVAKTLLFMGIVNARHGQYERAMEFLQGAIRIRKYLVGYYQNVIRVSGSSKAVNVVHPNTESLSSVNIARSHINRDEEIKRELFDEETELSIVSYNIGNVYLKLGDLKTALTCFEDMLDIRRRHCGAPKNTSQLLDDFLDVANSNERGKRPDEGDLSSIADALHNCGCCYFFLKQFDKALSCYNEALVIKGTLCRVSTTSSSSKGNGSSQSRNSGQNNKLVRFSGSRGHGGRDAANQGDTLTYATTLKSIGAVHSKLTNYDMALQHYETALQIQRSHLGYDHIAVASTLADMGHLLRRTNYKTDVAAKCYKESLRISKLQLGSDHEDVANLMYNLGYVYDTMHRYRQAVVCYRECVKLYGKKYSHGLVYRLLRCRRSKQLCHEDGQKESISRDVRFDEYQSSSDETSHAGDKDSRENYHRVLGALRDATQKANESDASVGVWTSEDYCRINFEAFFLQFLEFLSDYFVDPTRNAVKKCVNDSVKSLEKVSSNAVVTARDTMAYQFLYLIQE